MSVYVFVLQSMVTIVYVQVEYNIVSAVGAEGFRRLAWHVVCIHTGLSGVHVGWERDQDIVCIPACLRCMQAGKGLGEGMA